MVIISAIVCIYYNVILAWNFYFMYMSVSKVLPWTLCDQSWNTKQCVVPTEDYNVTVLNGTIMTVKQVSNIRASSEFWE